MALRSLLQTSLKTPSEIWGISEVVLVEHSACVNARREEILNNSKQLDTSSLSDNSPWSPITNPLEIVTLSDNGRTATIDIKGVFLLGSSSTRWLITEGYYVDPLLVEKAVKQLEDNQFVEKIIFNIDSPGGNTAGMHSLGITIASSSKSIESITSGSISSAAWWVAAPSDKISADKMSQLGSIGTMVRLVDSSKYYQQAGLKVHVISTGALKGSFTEGKEVTTEELAYAQELVDSVNKIFLDFISTYRKVDTKQISSGKVWLAEEAKSLGLVDTILNETPTKKTKQKEKLFMDFQAFWNSLTAEQKSLLVANKESLKVEAPLQLSKEAMEQIEASNKRAAMAEAKLKEIESIALTNQYSAEAATFGNIVGVDQKELTGFLMSADTAGIGKVAREIIKGAKTVQNASELLKTKGTNAENVAPAGVVAVNGGSDYAVLNQRANEISTKEGISYGAAFLKAASEAK